MKSTSKNRLIHITGVMISIAVLLSAASLNPSVKDVVVCVVAGVALLANAFGVARPRTWFH